MVSTARHRRSNRRRKKTFKTNRSNGPECVDSLTRFTVPSLFSPILPVYGYANGEFCHMCLWVCVCVRPANDSRSRYRNSKQKTLGKENVRIWEMRTGDDTIIMKYETTQSPPPPPSLSFMLSPSESATSPVRPFPSMLGI